MSNFDENLTAHRKSDLYGTITRYAGEHTSTSNAWGGYDFSNTTRTVRVFRDDNDVRVVVITPRGVTSEVRFSATSETIIAATVRALMNEKFAR